MEKKYYAYLLPNGKKGITDNWPECERLVKGNKGSRFKGFKNRIEASEWLESGALYEIKTKRKMPEGIYFDAGTGRGEGVEVSVTDKDGKDILDTVLHPGLINKHGKHLLQKGKTNNYGELLACKYALEIAGKTGIKSLFGDSKLVIEYWSKGFIKKAVDAETIRLAEEVRPIRREFESQGGKIVLISGDDNPADLGFHR